MLSKTVRFILIVLLVGVFLPFVIGEDTPKKTVSPGDDDFSRGSLYAERESQARNFSAWWIDNANYLITPREYIYTGRIANRDDVVRLLVLVGYRGECEEVVRTSAIHELRRMGPSVIKMVGELVDGTSTPNAALLPGGVRRQNLRGFAAYALGEIGLTDGIPYLASALDSDDILLKAACAVSLGKLGGLEYLPKIVEVFKSGERARDPYVRSAFLAALSHLADPRALPEVLENLADRDPRVRTNLATALGLLSEEAGARVIQQYLRENGSSQALRIACTWALSEIGKRSLGSETKQGYKGEIQEIERELSRLAMHENIVNNRCNIALSLGYLGTSRSESVLNAMLYDPNFDVRACAAAGLRLMGRDLKSNSIIAEDQELLRYSEIVESCARKVEANDIVTALPTFAVNLRDLRSQGKEGAAAALLPILAKGFVPGSISLLETSANSDSQIISEVALISLGMVRDSNDMKRSVLTLQKFASVKPADDNSERTCALASVGLGMLNSDRPLVFLKSRLRVNERDKGAVIASTSASISLCLLGGLPYREPLLELLNSDKSPAVKSAAVFSLGMIRCPGVLESLIGILQRETNIDLRVNACFALSLLGERGALPALYSIMTDDKLARSADGNYLRGCAALAMSRMNPTRAFMIELRRQMSKTDDENFLSFAALAIGLSGDRAFLEVLTTLLNSNSKQVREAACLGLGFSGDESYLPELSDIMTKSADALTRLNAAVACGLLGSSSAIESLCEMLSPTKEGNPIVRAGASIGLALLGSNKEFVIAKLAESDKDPDPRCRKLAAISRFVLGDPSGFEPMVGYLSSGGMDFMRLDSNLLRDWANSQLPPFIKLRSYLFE